MRGVGAVLEAGSVDESDLQSVEALQFPDPSSLSGTAWQNSTSRAMLPTSTALQLLRAQPAGAILLGQLSLASLRDR